MFLVVGTPRSPCLSSTERFLIFPRKELFRYTLRASSSFRNNTLVSQDFWAKRFCGAASQTVGVISFTPSWQERSSRRTASASMTHLSNSGHSYGEVFSGLSQTAFPFGIYQISTSCVRGNECTVIRDSLVSLTTKQFGTSCHISPLVEPPICGWRCALGCWRRNHTLAWFGKLSVRNSCFNPFLHRLFCSSCSWLQKYFPTSRKGNWSWCCAVVVVDHDSFISPFSKVKKTKVVLVTWPSLFVWRLRLKLIWLDETCSTANERIRGSWPASCKRRLVKIATSVREGRQLDRSQYNKKLWSF